MKTLRIPNQEYRPVLGYEGLYEISPTGHIISLGREKPTKWDDTGVATEFTTLPDHVMISRITGNDADWTVGLTKNGKRTRRTVGRWILEAYRLKPVDAIAACRKDTTKTATLDNLFWSTRNKVAEKIDSLLASNRALQSA